MAYKIDPHYEPDETNLKIAIRFGEAIREHLIQIEAFDASAAMRDLLAVAYVRQIERTAKVNPKS